MKHLWVLKATLEVTLNIKFVTCTKCLGVTHYVDITLGVLPTMVPLRESFPTQGSVFHKISLCKSMLLLHEISLRKGVFFTKSLIKGLFWGIIEEKTESCHLHWQKSQPFRIFFQNLPCTRD